MDDDPNAFFCRGTSSLGHRKQDTLSRIRPHHNQSFGIGVCAVAPEPMRQIGAEVQTIVCTQAVFFGGPGLQPLKTSYTLMVIAGNLSPILLTLNSSGSCDLRMMQLDAMPEVVRHLDRRPSRQRDDTPWRRLGVP